MKEHRLSRAVTPELQQIPETVSWVLSESPAWVDQSLLDTGLTEALTNAIVHGVLGVTSSGRGEDMTEYLDRVERSSLAAGALGPPVTVSLASNDERFLVALSWQGVPCPEENQIPPSRPRPLAGSGLGATLIHSCFDDVSWGADGRSVDLCLVRRR